MRKHRTNRAIATHHPITHYPIINEHLAAIKSRLDRFEGETREQISTLFDGLVALSQQTTNLANRVDQLTELMVQFAQNAEADRAEIRRIWEYLLQQSGNGHQQP